MVNVKIAEIVQTTAYTHPDLKGLELREVDAGMEIYQNGIHQTNVEYHGWNGRTFAEGYFAAMLQHNVLKQL